MYTQRAHTYKILCFSAYNVYVSDARVVSLRYNVLWDNTATNRWLLLLLPPTNIGG